MASPDIHVRVPGGCTLPRASLDGTAYSSELPGELTRSVGGNTRRQLKGFCGEGMR